MNAQNDYKVILFDLGGVLLKLRDPISTFELDIDESEFLTTWITSPSVRALESGQIDGVEFAQRIVQEMKLPMEWRELLRRFDDWPDGFYPKATDLIERVASRYTCAILSNTNPVHWEKADVEKHFGDSFDRCFLSYESGLLKPDQASFLQVVETYACLPQEILFFDDNPVNVRAARKEGFASVRIDGPDQLELALIDAGLI
jgi:putative hydrolase of the HAD superfamily